MPAMTFVTIGKNAGKSCRIGPDSKYVFKDGEMECPEGLVDLVARSLRLYGAFPKSEAMPYHLAACKALNIDHETLEPLGQEAPVVAAAKALQTEAAMAPGAETSSESFRERLETAVAGLDPDDNDHWTANGLPSINFLQTAMNEILPKGIRSTLDEIGVVRGDLADI